MSNCVRCVDRKPKNAGEYNISIDGVFTFAPIFMKFDGEEWDWQDAAWYGKTKEQVWWYPGEDE